MNKRWVDIKINISYIFSLFIKISGSLSQKEFNWILNVRKDEKIIT